MAGTKESTKTDVWQRIAGAWIQAQGEVRRQWGRLTDDDLLEIRGQYEKLVGKVQMRYGVSREEAIRQVDNWAQHVKF